MNKREPEHQEEKNGGGGEAGKHGEGTVIIWA